MNLRMVPLMGLLVLGLLTGGFVVIPDAAAVQCIADCEEEEDKKDDDGAVLIIDGGDVVSSATIDLTADGGAGVADASGGDLNVATSVDIAPISGGGAGDAEAGNGGVAMADADGGLLTVGNITTGGNSGNTIVVGSVGGDDDCKDCECKDCECKDCDCKDCECKDCECKDCGCKNCHTVVVKTTTTTASAVGSTRVARLPSTGVGPLRSEGAADGALLVLAVGAGLGAAGFGLRRRDA